MILSFAKHPILIAAPALVIGAEAVSVLHSMPFLRQVHQIAVAQLYS